MEEPVDVAGMLIAKRAMSLFESLFAGVLLLTLTATGFAEEAAAVSTPNGVDDAVARLGSSDRATRLAAERELLERGPDLLAHLPAAGDVDDAAVRIAIERIRKRLELERASQTLRAGRLNWHGADPVDALLASYVALTPEQTQQTAGLEVNDVHYWTVIDSLAKQIDGWPDRVLPDGQMTFRDRTPVDDRKRLAYVGPFRLAAGPVDTKPVAGDASQRLVRVPVALRAEPRLRPLFVSYAAKDLQLVAADGRALPPFTAAARYELPVGDRGEATDLRLDFLDAAATTGTLKLSGTLRVTLAASEQRFAFPFAEIVQSPAETSSGGVTVRVRQARRNDDGTATVELAVVYDRGGPAFESHRTWVYHNEAVLVYEAIHENQTVEHRLDHEPGFSTIAQADGGVVLAYRFTGLPDNAQHVEFVYRAPTSILEAPVEFAIDDLKIEPR